MTTLGSLRAWADTWLPDDPDMMERDPDVVLGWLARRVDSERVPGRPVVLELRLPHRGDRRYWLVLEQGLEPYGCLTDPLLDESRYLYIEVSMSALLARARRRRDWSDAFGDGSVTAAGDPDLVSQVAGWFRPASEQVPSAHAELNPLDGQAGASPIRALNTTTTPPSLDDSRCPDEESFARPVFRPLIDVTPAVGGIDDVVGLRSILIMSVGEFMTEPGPAPGSAALSVVDCGEMTRSIRAVPGRAHAPRRRGRRRRCRASGGLLELRNADARE